MTFSLRCLILILSHRTRNLVWHVPYKITVVWSLCALFCSQNCCVFGVLWATKGQPWKSSLRSLISLVTAVKTIPVDPRFHARLDQVSDFRQRFCCLATPLIFKTSFSISSVVLLDWEMRLETIRRVSFDVLVSQNCFGKWRCSIYMYINEMRNTFKRQNLLIT